MTTQVMNENQRLHSLKSATGEVFTVGDSVNHQGGEGTAEITGFYWDDEHREFRAKTTKGNAGLDYLSKVE